MESSPVCSLEDVKQACELFLKVAPVIELRTFGGQLGPGSGLFNNADELAAFAQKLSGKVEGVYVVFNRLAPSTLPVMNVWEKGRKAAKDADIESRCWLLIDCDPERPKHTSATDAEHGLALHTVENIRAFLSDKGWPEPVVADSGNGAHLLYAIDLPNDEASTQLVKNVLGALQAMFGSKEVDVDQAVFNASRLTKLYGTLACKGANASERPHRASKLLYSPEHIEVVEKAKLEALAMGFHPASVAVGKKGAKFNVSKWLDAHAGKLPKLIAESDWKAGAHRWGFDGCFFNGDHKKNASSVIIQFPNGQVVAKCLHKTCEGKDWAALRDLVEPGWHENSPAPKANGADVLFSFIEDELELFRGSDGRPYGTARLSGLNETYNLKSSQVREWIIRRYRERSSTLPGVEHLNAAITAAVAYANGGKLVPVYTRVANHNGIIYLDLGTPDWSCVRVCPNGWDVVTTAPVRFRRHGQEGPLPIPKKGGSLEELKHFLNFDDDAQWILMVSWVLAAFSGQKPFPVLVLNGPKGAAKSTSSEVLRRLVDPAMQGNLKALPKEVRDLAVAGANSYLLNFTNISHIDDEMSDALCRIAKGEGLGTRQLFTDDGQFVFASANPVCVDGIENFAVKGDLLDRAILVTLPAISDSKRQDEATFWSSFNEAVPGILGALLDVVAVGLKNLPITKLSTMSRMADYNRWCGLRTCSALEARGILGSLQRQPWHSR